MRTLTTAAIALGLAAAALGQIDPNRTVATINGEAIKGGEYYRRMEFLPQVGKKVGQGMMEAPPGFLTILQLIGERLMLQLAKEKGVYPTDAEVKAEIEYRRAEDPDFITNWAATGQTQAQLEDEMRYEVAKFKLQTRGITITDLEIDKFYKENPQMFTSPKKYKLWVLAVPNEQEASAAEADLKSGKKFSEVARERSVDVTASLGGDLGTVPVMYLPDPARAAVEKTKIGSSSTWVDQRGVKVKYFVETIIPEKKAELTPHLKAATRRKLMIDRGRTKNDVAAELNAMRSKSKIVITHPEFAKLYEKIDQLGG